MKKLKNAFSRHQILLRIVIMHVPHSMGSSLFRCYFLHYVF